MPIYRLPDDDILFPRPELAEPDGLLAVGGDVRPERLLAAYSLGIFPWSSEDEPILWWCPHPRAVLEPDQLHVSRSLKKRLRQGRFTVSCDRAFEQVIHACAHTRLDVGEDTWLYPELARSFLTLHQAGLAHSVEVWSGAELVGGLYGLQLGNAYFGDSMFSTGRDTSKVAFVHLVAYLRAIGVELIDCQLPTPHLSSLGVGEISRRSFLKRLRAAMEKVTPQHPWSWPPPGLTTEQALAPWLDVEAPDDSPGPRGGTE